MKRKTSFNARAFACIFAFTLLFVFLINPFSQAGVKPEKTTVIYGGSSWIGHYPAWIGIKKGLFKNKGLEVRFEQFYTSSARMGALISGDLDFASTGSISAIALMAVGVKSFYAFGTQDSYAKVEGIIAKNDIHSVQDLRGAKLAVTFASSAHVLVLDVLERNGLDAKRDIKLINLKVSEMPAAFKSGEVDACALWTPHFNKLLSMKDTHVLLDVTDFTLFKKYGVGTGPDVMVVRKDFAEKYPATSRRFVEAYFESIELLKNSPKECAKVLVELTNLSLDNQLEVLEDITWYGLEKQRELMVEPGSFVAGLQKLGEFLARHGQIDQSPEVRNWVNVNLLK